MPNSINRYAQLIAGCDYHIGQTEQWIAALKLDRQRGVQLVKDLRANLKEEQQHKPSGPLSWLPTPARRQRNNDISYFSREISQGEKALRANQAHLAEAQGVLTGLTASRAQLLSSSRPQRPT